MTVVALDSRRAVLGGSTIAAAAGIDPWCSPVELFYRMRGELPEGEQLGWGQRIQPLIFAELRERGYGAHETPGVELIDDAYPWLVGHPDGLAGAAPPMGGPDWIGDVIVEAKLTGGYGYRKGDGLPLNWQAQVQTYMRLGHVERALVAVLTAGIRLDVHEVIYDERGCDLLLELGAAFVDCLRRGEAPRPDGSQSAREALSGRFPRQEPGKVYRLTGAEWDTAKHLRLLREQARELERQITETENIVKSCDPEAETFIDPHDGTFATWKEVTSHRFDTKGFREDRPELAELWTRETTSRRFLVND